ncbi:MAG: DUF4390 domain-containing protein [Desulfobacterales bacterium]|nr:DUF4390 domain-containing protein [Desulfobacterales bacterium]
MPAPVMFRLAGTLFMCLLLMAPPAADASPAALRDLTVAISPDALLLHGQVQGAFTDELRQSILAGTPTLFLFRIVFKQVKGLWPDETLADIEIAQTIRYDDSRREFVVRRSYESEPRVTRSFEEAQAWVSRIDGVKITPLDRISRGLEYQLRVKAVAGKRGLPLGLHHALFFMSFWRIETDWVIIDFIF